MKAQNIILISLAIVISFIIGYNFNGNITYKNIQQIVVDTLFIEKQSEPIIIKEIKPKLIYRHDTVIVTPPFIAKVDTIIQRDTIRIEYFYPENLMNLSVFPKPDSLEIRNIYITKEITKSNNWWELPAGILSGVILGYFIGNKGN